MPRKPGLNSEFVMFDVVYEDGSQRSNRKVPRELTWRARRRQAGARLPDRAGPRDRRKIRQAALKIKSITRSGAKKKERDYAERRADCSFIRREARRASPRLLR